MIEVMQPDGTYRRWSDKDYIAEFGEKAFRKFQAPVVEEAAMTEGQKYLANKMQSEHGVNAAAARAGVDSIFDLPSWDDDESIPLDDLVPQEYDDAGAAADYEARKARQ